MDELIDFDGLFDEKLAEYMQNNFGKYTEKQWESVIPKLYQKFGDTYVARVKNTPKGYYAAMSDDKLVACLAAHVREGVPASDFLCRELEGRGCPDALVGLLHEENTELLTFAVNLIGSEEKAFEAYFGILAREDADPDVVEAVCEQLKGNADAAKTRALAFYTQGIRPELMLEILSRVKQRDDAVYEILLRAFRECGDELPMRASYLAAYGDPRALGALLEVIDRDDINFLEFQELRYAIEALGGEYNRPRDFSNDPYYQEILSQQSAPVDPSSLPKSDA